MAYTRVNWQDSPSTATPRNATNLNKMDLGISTADTNATAAQTDATNALNRLANEEIYVTATAGSNGDFKVTLTNTALTTNRVVKIAFPAATNNTQNARLSIDNGVAYKNIKNINGNQFIASSIENQKGMLFYDGTNFIVVKMNYTTVPYGKQLFVNNAGSYSTNSATLNYIDQTNGKVTMNVKEGKLIMVEMFLTGLYNNNTGYGVNFDIGIDGNSTKSTSGVVSFSYSSFFGNWATDGSRTVGVYTKFYISNITPGSHTFYALWSSDNSAATAYIKQYGTTTIYVTELFN